MKLATLAINGQFRPAIVLGEDVLDLVAAKALSPVGTLVPSDVIGILAGGETALEIIRKVAEDCKHRVDAYRARQALLSAASASFAAPIPNPRIILAVGANYHEHLREMNTPPPTTPMAFYKSLSSIIGSGANIVLPRSNPDMVDFEGEFTAVIGRTCHNVSEADALDFIGGYTVINDVSARDWVAPAFQAQGMINTVVAWEHNILGKLFPTFCPMGPYVVTSDEVGDPHNLKVETRLNGQVMQSARTSDLVFNLKQIIAYYSKFFAFEPGDVIMTGSPSGVGFGRKPPIYMKHGDIIEVSIEKIGTLRNTISRS